MAKFEVDFQIQGVGEVSLPVTLLDDALVRINGLETKVFRFSILNSLASAFNFSLSTVLTGDAAAKVAIAFDSTSLSIEPGQSVVITTAINPIEPLLEGDTLSVKVIGQSV